MEVTQGSEGKKSRSSLSLGDEAWQMNTLGRGSLIPMGRPDHAQAAEMVLTGTMLPGRGLTCTKSWALGEEFSTMRFTILMRVSLSLICSRGRNGRFTLRPEPASSTTLLCLPSGHRGGWLLSHSQRLGMVSLIPHPVLTLSQYQSWRKSHNRCLKGHWV